MDWSSFLLGVAATYGLSLLGVIALTIASGRGRRRGPEHVERHIVQQHPSGAVVITRQTVPVPHMEFDELDERYMAEMARKEGDAR